jgi:hypothetical protein
MSAWADQANSNNASQPSIAWQPSLISSGINGLPSVEFHGPLNNGTYMTISNFLSGLSEGEIFVVGQLDADPPATSSAAGLYYFGSGSPDTLFPDTDGIIYDQFGSTIRRAAGNPTPSLTSPFIYNVSSSPGRWTNRVNGSQLTTFGTNTVGWHSVSIRIGSGLSGAGLNYDGLISRVLFYSKILSNSQRAAKVIELKNLYGIA